MKSKEESLINSVVMDQFEDSTSTVPVDDTNDKTFTNAIFVRYHANYRYKFFDILLSPNVILMHSLGQV